MRTLLLQLPLTAPGPSTAYGVAELDLSDAGLRVQPGHAPLALLPRAERQTEVVAMVSAAALSWHRVSLPAGLRHGNTKLQAVLQGLLEDRLLQDPRQVHMALAPQWQSGEPVWVAACDKSWLQAHLQALQVAGLPVQRIVPELAPPRQGQHWHALGDDALGWLWCCDAQQGVNGWPVNAATPLPTDMLANTPLQVEPGLARWAQARMTTSVQLVDSAAHWLAAARGDWNLAQFELQSDARTRRLQTLRRQLDAWVRAPQWRPARWGLAVLLVSQLLGLQAWAWATQQQWQNTQDQWTNILQQSFPKVSVVVDAPLQMARELDLLRQGSGQLTPQDFESQLQALGQALPAGSPGPTRLNWQDGQLQWPTLALSTAQQAELEQGLQRQGYRLTMEAGNSLLQAREARP